MFFYVVGIAHASLAIREKVSFTDQAKLTFQQLLYTMRVDGCVIVSTCNRSEVYITSDEKKQEELEEVYRTFFSLSKEDSCFLYEGKEALGHLFQVCAGLDSQILGEDQILKQVKDAYAFAQASQMVNKAIHLIFQEAFHFAKVCKHQCKLGEHPTSSSYFVYKILKERSLLQSAILLCGAGDVIQRCLPYVKDCCVTILTRNVEKVKDLERLYPNVVFASLENRYLEVAKCDVLISATASPHPLFKKQYMPIDTKKRVLFDMAVPRDIEHTIKDMSCYEVYDIDEIQQYLQLHEDVKQCVLTQAKALLEKAVIDCFDKLSLLPKEPVIAHMQQYLSSMSMDTYALLDQKLNLSAHEQRVVKKTLDYSYLRFLQEFTSLVKESNEEVLQVLETWILKGGK